MTFLFWFTCYVLYMAMGWAFFKFLAEYEETLCDLITPKDGDDLFALLYFWHCWVIVVPMVSFIKLGSTGNGLSICAMFRKIFGTNNKVPKKEKKEDYI